MKYALLGYGPYVPQSDTFDNAILSFELADAETATTVRVRNGKVALADGAYGGRSEELCGVWVIDVPDLDGALAVAQRWPAARLGAVEVRPLRSV